MITGLQSSARPLLVVHPDFPWLGLASLTWEWTQEFCLPVLRRIVAAARFRQRRGAPVLVIPAGSSQDWAGDQEAGILLRELAECATHLAPDRINALGAKRWLSDLKLPTAVLAAGFWRHHCVAEVRRAVPSILIYPLSVARP